MSSDRPASQPLPGRSIHVVDRLGSGVPCRRRANLDQSLRAPTEQVVTFAGVVSPAGGRQEGPGLSSPHTGGFGAFLGLRSRGQSGGDSVMMERCYISRATRKPNFVTGPNRGERTRAELERHIGVLERQFDALEQRHAVDRELMAHLQAEAALEREKVASPEIALVSARRIGAAMGILMALYKVTNDPAFERLRTVATACGRSCAR